MPVLNLHILKRKAFTDWLDNIFISFTLVRAFPTAFSPIKAPVFIPSVLLLSQTKILSPAVCQFKLWTSQFISPAEGSFPLLDYFNNIIYKTHLL